MRYIFLLVFSGCAPIPFGALEGTRLEICKNSELYEIGTSVKVANARGDLKGCKSLGQIKVEKCNGVGKEKVLYVNALRNKVGWLKGNILYPNSDVAEGEGYVCPKAVYDSIN